MEYVFCEKLKELRTEKGLGQVELANALNVSKGIISLWENGLREPKLSNLIALSKFFDVSIDYLVGLENWKKVRFRLVKAHHKIDKFRQETCRFLFKPKGLACNHGLPCMELPSGVCHFGLMPCNSIELIAYRFADYIHATAWLNTRVQFTPLKLDRVANCLLFLGKTTGFIPVVFSVFLQNCFRLFCWHFPLEKV